jgi:hypothetical protein
VFVLVFIGILAFLGIEYQNKPVLIRNFEECVLAGKPVINSVPKRCEVSKDQFIVDIAGIQKGDIGKKGLCDSYVFNKYRITEVFEDVVPVNFDSYPDSKKFKTAIQSAVAGGPNFSGHYTVASWGCGTSCQENAIIDMKTGDILVFGIASQYGVSTKRDSKLFIVNPRENIPDYVTKEEKNTLTTSFYILENNALVLLCREGE